MYASIQSTQFHDFYCRVLLEPVIKTSSYNVFELAGTNSGIESKTKNRPTKIYNHVAIDRHGNCHLFDKNKSILALNMGPCVFTPD